jgi:hypothetical protein
MATVPSPRGLSVVPQGAERLPLQSIQPPALAFDRVATGERLGISAQGNRDRSDILAKHAQDFQAINNKVAADDRFVGYTEVADRTVVDYKAGNVGMAAYDNLGAAYTQLEEARAKGAEGLTPDAALAYNASSRAALVRAQSSLRDFAVTQRKGAVIGSAEATVKTAQALASGAEIGTPAWNEALTTISDQVDFMARPDVAGLSSEQAAYAKREALGSVFQTKISESLSVGDYPRAQELFDANKGTMTEDQIRSVNSSMKVGQNAYIANSERMAWMTREPISPASVDLGEWDRGLEAARADPAAFFSEVAGGPVTITSGERTPEDNAAVRGSPTSAHLFNQGWDFSIPAGKTPEQAAQDVAANLHAKGIPFDQVEVDSRPNNTHIHVGFGAKNRNEIIDHTGKRVGEVGQTARTDRPVIPTLTPTTDPNEYLADSIAAATKYANTKYAHNPTLAAQVTSSIVAGVRVEVAQLQAQQTARYTRLDRAILANDIQDTATLSRAYPGAAEDLANLPPNYMRTLENSLKSNANSMTPERQDNFLTLTGMKRENPQQFAQEDLTKYDLPASTFRSLVQQQQTTRAELKEQSERVAQTDTTIRQALNTTQAKAALASLNLEPEERSAAYYNFAGALSVELDNYAAIHGKPPVAGSKEMSAIISQVTAVVGAKKGWGWFNIGGEEGRPSFRVPDNLRPRIQEALIAEGLDPNNEMLIAQRYRMATDGR